MAALAVCRRRSNSHINELLQIKTQANISSYEYKIMVVVQEVVYALLLTEPTGVA